MTRPAPSPRQIHDFAARLNDLCRRGFTCKLPEEGMDHIAGAFPGEPSKGLQLFQNALHPAVRVTTLSNGAWMFWIPLEARTAGRRAGT